ncbi:MAG: 50S ribosomal protein L10 [Candidatus Zambryskibacteria bacterium]|nr:50S ribosomal protein L10 [Candidatus Zambryskibacteria bacterium]
MALTKEKKAEILEKLRKIVKDSLSIVFVNFHALPVKESSAVRKVLREKGIGYTIAKKTLTKKALSEGAIIGEIPEMPGELGIVYSPAVALAKEGGTDSIEPARGIYEFQKKLDKKIQIVGGVFEGKFLNQAEMLVIAQIPGLQSLRAMFVNLINSPIQRFAIALNAIAQVKS